MRPNGQHMKISQIHLEMDSPNVKPSVKLKDTMKIFHTNSSSCSSSCKNKTSEDSGEDTGKNSFSRAPGGATSKSRGKPKKTPKTMNNNYQNDDREFLGQNLQNEQHFQDGQTLNHAQSSQNPSGNSQIEQFVALLKNPMVSKNPEMMQSVVSMLQSAVRDQQANLQNECRMLIAASGKLNFGNKCNDGQQFDKIQNSEKNQKVSKMNLSQTGWNYANNEVTGLNRFDGGQIRGINEFNGVEHDFGWKGRNPGLNIDGPVENRVIDGLRGPLDKRGFQNRLLNAQNSGNLKFQNFLKNSDFSNFQNFGLQTHSPTSGFSSDGDRTSQSDRTSHSDLNREFLFTSSICQEQQTLKRELFMHNLVTLIDNFLSNENILENSYLAKFFEKCGISGLPSISVKKIAGFKNIKSFTTDLSTVQLAIKKSNLFELSRDGLLAVRKVELPNELPVQVIKTVIAINIPGKFTVEGVTRLFEKYGEVVQVSQLK